MRRRIESPDTQADIALREFLAGNASSSFVMSAGAGSGKTTSLVKALAFLRQSKEADLRVSGQRVACITYTEIAAKEIHGEIEQDPLIHVATIHSFLWSVIKPFQRDVAIWVAARIDEKVAAFEEHNAKPGTRAATRVKNDIQIARLREDRAAAAEVTSFSYGTGSRYGLGILGHDDIIKMVPQLIIAKPLLRKVLAQSYPYIFVDESQDTFPTVVEALKSVSNDPECAAKIGFFGDPMQQIYTTGMGSIAPETGWATIDKPENFRCPTAVLKVINNIRRESIHSLNQVGGRRETIGGVSALVEGNAHLFVAPTSGDREAYLALIREWLATNTLDPAWLIDDEEADVRILVIEHRLAARRLGFETVFASHHDKSTDTLKSGIAEGTAWPTLPFVDYLTPLACATRDSHKYSQIQLLRKYSPALLSLEVSLSSSSVLNKLSVAAKSLEAMLADDSNISVREVLKFASDAGLWAIDDKYREYEALLAGEESALDDAGTTDSKRLEHDVVSRFLDSPARELLPYQSYLTEHSVYSTQQGVKGSEFERVLVLLEDDAAKGVGFSYDKLLGLRELSPKDRENAAAGADNAIDRTRRLFYVACSRAERSLAVVLFASDAKTAASQLRQLDIFDPENVHELPSVLA